MSVPELDPADGAQALLMEFTADGQLRHASVGSVKGADA
jgi:hypothetical protein